MVPGAAQRPAADQRNRRCRVAQRRQFQIGQRQVLDLGGGIAGDKINNLLAKGMDHPRQQNGKQGHNGQRLARGRPRPPPIALAEAKGHHHRGAQIDGGKEGHDDHVKAIGQPHPGHGLFSQPADKEGAQHPHQQHTGIFQQNGHSERADFAPVQHTITLTFF